MRKYKKIPVIIFLVGSCLAGHATASVTPMGNLFMTSDQQDKTMTLRIEINGGNTKLNMENVPTSGHLEVYSILGVKVTSVNLKTCEGGNCYLQLPKGLYIFKAGKVAVKIIVR